MRIEKIIIKNFRQYKNLELTFPDDKPNDLHLIVGKNGMGKTTLLNAINWCLYNEEPHTSENSSKLPILNLNALENTKEEYPEVMVELWITDENKDFIIIQRTQPYRIHKRTNLPIPQNNEFIVRKQDEMGNTKILEDEEANDEVENFVPIAIREFFFFDGERLDNFFKKKKGDKISKIENKIFRITQINYLVNMENRLKKITKELGKKAGDIDPEIKAKNRELDVLKEKNENIKLNIEDAKKQIELANKEIKDYEDRLKNSRDATSLDSRRKERIINLKKLNKLYNNKNLEKKELLLQSAKSIYLWPAINDAIICIEEKKRKNEIPPTVDKSLLEKILFNDNCDICGRHLEENSRKKVEKLLKNVSLSTEIVRELSSMENPLINYKDKVLNFRKTRDDLQKDLEYFIDEIKNEETEIEKLNQDLSGINIDQIRNWHEDRLKLEAANKTNLIKLGSLEEQLKINNKAVKRLEDEKNKLVKRGKNLIEINKKLSFTKKALKVIEKTKDSIMQETRKYIELETKRIFFELLWKKATFKDVKIDDEYNINLIHNSGYDCLGSVSAAERELLALSFTLALHKVSGYNSPILIDTPVAKVSDEHRENFANIFMKVSENKQIILLFTPAEYSDDIKSIFQDNINSEYAINFVLEEKEASIGGYV